MHYRIAYNVHIMADRETERRRYAKTAAKFAKLQALHDTGAPVKEKRKLSENWQNRRSGHGAEFRVGTVGKRDAGVANMPELKPSGIVKRVRYA